MLEICEVGPRDGLQNEKANLSVDDRVSLIEKLISSGVRLIEAVSFVSAKVVPQMAFPEEVLERVPRKNGVKYTALVLSERGVNRALSCELDEINFVLAASDTFNLKNAKRTARESFEGLSPLIEKAKKAGRKVNATIGTAFGCPFEGQLSEERIMMFAHDFIESGANLVTFADTTGVANPLQVERYVNDFYSRFPKTPLALHFHNTRGLGIANVLAGYESGVRRFDTAVGGTGGCPFAPLSVGNVCTEDVVHMFEQMKIEVPIRIDKLVETAKWLENKVGHTLSGYVMKAGSADKTIQV